MRFQKLLTVALLFTTIALSSVSATYETLQKGRRFLEENAKKEGVHTTSSGLQYKVLDKGTGASPSATDYVEVYYHGYLINGKVFDETKIIQGPARFQVDQVIDGWTEALMLMSEGALWEVYIPSELAYGKKGSLPTIPPDSVLIFEIELVSVLK